MDYEALREKMVKEQIVLRGIKDHKIIEAFYKVERHKFVPGEIGVNAYGDFPLAIGEGQTISQPYMVALMTEALGLRKSNKVLEVGTGSGYQSAILSGLVRKVYTIERFESLNRRAQRLLKELSCNNIKFKVGDGSLGWQEAAPFDRIIVTAASPQIPLPLIEQLSPRGRLLLPLCDGVTQVLTLVKKKRDQVEFNQICGCVFVPLVGKYGQEE